MNDAGRSAWAVVPVKAFESAKSRLSPVLTPQDRARLARSMFEHVLSVLRAVPALSGTLVVAESQAVIDAAARAGAVAVPDPGGAKTLADCVDLGLDTILERGASSAVVLVSDLPTVTKEDIAALVEPMNRFDVVIAKDRGGEHTNALALRLDKGFRTSFGADDSFRRHLQTAERLGLSVCEIDKRSLAFDVDTPGDYAAWLGRRG